MTFNKIVYSFKIKKVLSLLYKKNPIRNNIINKSLKYRIETIDVIVFVNAKIQIYYDAKYTLLILKSSDCVYLRLNYNYYLFDKFSKKTLF